jgi:hypothetical protein
VTEAVALAYPPVPAMHETPTLSCLAFSVAAAMANAQMAFTSRKSQRRNGI